MTVWVALEAPAGTPKPVLDKINASLQKALKSPNVVQRFADMGIQPRWTSIEQFTTFKAAEIQKYGQLVKTAGVKVE